MTNGRPLKERKAKALAGGFQVFSCGFNLNKTNHMQRPAYSKVNAAK